jgi:hypothetical protein
MADLNRPSRRPALGERDAWNSFKVTPVSREKVAAIGGDDSGDQAVGHSDGVARPFKGSPNLAGLRLSPPGSRLGRPYRK